jgi:hypothetical protein
MKTKFNTLVESILFEKKDACYNKVKRKYQKSGAWPSYYAAGALSRCRKKGAKNWGQTK